MCRYMYDNQLITGVSYGQVKTERIREELHRVEEDQLGAALRARRKKRELQSMSRQVCS